MEVPPAMGIAIAINFQPTGGGKAAITGDFVLLAERGEPGAARPARARHRGDGAAQPHAGRQPRLFFMHFWANADATALARGLRAALDQTHTAAPSS